MTNTDEVIGTLRYRYRIKGTWWVETRGPIYRKRYH
jgi:hypothetical protein